MFGDLGADTLTGNAGNDALTGGQGADRFILSRDSDVIADFNAAEGDSIAILSSTLHYSLLDSADGLQISRADLGTTTLRGITTASFNENTSIVPIGSRLSRQALRSRWAGARLAGTPQPWPAAAAWPGPERLPAACVVC